MPYNTSSLTAASLRDARRRAAQTQEQVKAWSSRVHAFEREHAARAEEAHASGGSQDAAPASSDLARALERAREELRFADETLRDQCEALRRAYRMVERAHERYYPLFEGATDARVITDCGGTIEDANAAATELLGMPAAFLASKPLLHFVARGDTRTFRAALKDLSARPVADLHVRIRPRHRHPVACVLSSSGITDVTGKQVALMWTLRPATTPPTADLADEASELLPDGRQ
jgi:PAS domain-containing protein